MTVEEREELKRNYIFLLEMLNSSEDIQFQRECYLCCIERFWDVYINNEHPNLEAIGHHTVLLNLYTEKFNIEI